MLSKIPSFFKSKNVLITGGTGFMGTSLVYKLLKSCAGINRIYLLVREKENASLRSRFKQFASEDIFSSMDLSKVKMLAGDIRKKNLGMVPEIIDFLKDEVNVIVHLAANLNFNLPLNAAIQAHVNTTNDLLNIANDCKNMNCFMYTSTIFTKEINGRKPLEEKLYSQTIKPQALMELSEKYNCKDLEQRVAFSRSTSLNNYTFTKCASENLLAEPRSFPMGIFRPGIVIEAYTEPYRYWYKNPSDYLMFIQAIKNGFYRKPHQIASNLIPVDYAINCLLAAIVDTTQNSELQIYNYSTHPDNPITFQDAVQYFFEGVDVEFESYHNKLFKIAAKSVMDECDESTLSMIINSNKVMRALEYFIGNNPTDVVAPNVDRLWNNLPEEDKRNFMFDLRTINWRDFHVNRFKLAKR